MSKMFQNLNLPQTELKKISHKKSPLRVMIFRMNSEMHLEILKNLIKDGLIEVIYWGGSKKGFKKAQELKEYFPNTIFHDSFDAVQGISASGVDAEKFEPIGADLAHAFGAVESQILIMMSSVEPTPVPILKKKHIYFKYLKYWHGVLSTLKPDAVFFGDVPHLTYQHLLYQVAKHLNIKTIMHRAVQIKGRIMFNDEIKEYEALFQKYKEYEKSDFSVEDLSFDISEHYKLQVERDKDSRLFYMQKSYINKISRSSYTIPSFQKILIHIKNLTFWKTARSYVEMFLVKKQITGIEPLVRRGIFMSFYYHKWKNIKKNFCKEYHSVMRPVDLSEKFVYVPLQNQPEGNTSAMGDVFVDQILMIDIVSSSLPKNWKLYVKESPLQWSAFRAYRGRYKGFYKRIADMKNVILVPAETSTIELIDASQAVATVTGTAGWEAVLRGKPALLFGYIWYMYCDGILRVDGGESVRRAFQKIQEGFKPDQQKVINFLKAVDETSVRAFQNTRFQKGNKLDITLEENIKNIQAGWRQAIKRYM
jgi:hypothetical protein